MTSLVPGDPSDQLTRALEATGALVEGVRPDQWDAATALPGWSVRDLVEHLVAGTRTVSARLLDRPEVEPSEDLAAAYRQGGQALLEAFAEPGVFERMVTVPAGTVPGAVALHLRLTELLVHGWDLARATGQPTTGLPDDVAEQELAFSRIQIGRIPPDRSPFAPSEPVADDAPAVDRLAALLGRKPG
jgi:uncharacterized protein (TIGR03086 family)